MTAHFKVNYICFTKCKGQDQKCLDTNMTFVTRYWGNKTEWTVQSQGYSSADRETEGHTDEQI